MVSTPDSRRRSPHARQAVLAATLDLLAEVGFARLTIEGIATRAGVGKQTIYRWWPTKGAVVFDALLDANRNADETHALPNTGDIERDLCAVLRASIEALNDPRTDQLQRAITAEIQHDLGLAEELVTRLLRPQMQATAERLEAARQVGQISDDVDIELAVELLFGPVFHRWLLRTAPLDAAYADRLARHALAGLRPRAA